MLILLENEGCMGGILETWRMGKKWKKMSFGEYSKIFFFPSHANELEKLLDEEDSEKRCLVTNSKNYQ